MKKWFFLFLLLSVSPVWSAPKPTPTADPADDPDYTSSPVKWPSIHAGDGRSKSGFTVEVAAIQYLLRNRGFYRGKVDGVFGSHTVAAVKAFQKSKGLHIDGIAGPRTLPKLVVVVKRGSHGDAVRAAQILARDAFTHIGSRPNIGLAVDGVYGKSTERAVAIAQNCIGGMEGGYDKSDGVMRPRSWCLMLGGEVVGGD